MGHTVIGLDINKDKLDEGTAYWKKIGVNFKYVTHFSEVSKDRGLYFMNRDGRNLDEFHSSSLDMITLFYVSGYMLGNNGGILRESSRLLKSESSLIVTTQGPDYFVPEFLKKSLVKIFSFIYLPNSLKTDKILTIKDNKIYDKYVLLMKKYST